MGAVKMTSILICFIVVYGGLTLVAGTPDNTPVPLRDKKVVCYIYTMKSHNRQNPFDFMPDQIDPFLCTHLIYAFADIGTKNNLVSGDPAFDLDMGGYANITALKRKNRDLKVMISVGGWKGGSLGFARITATTENRREFAKNAVRFIRGYMFDGLDLNWQHPTFREGGSMKDRENYALLAQVLREEFEREAVSKNKPRLLLSISITHHRKFMAAYDIPNFNTYMDFISVIGYDYHFSYESAVYHHAPLYSLDDDNTMDAKENVNHTIHEFMELADPAKLVLGLPTYGRTYRLEDPDDNGLGAYADGAGDKGPFTGENGWLAYFEICNFIERDDWTVVQMKPGSAGPYAYKGNQWVCYDDLEMIKNKAMYAHKMGLGGVMFWTMDYDDFVGTCKKTKMEPGLRTFPLIRTARNAMMNPSKYENERPVESTLDNQYGHENGYIQTPRPMMKPRLKRPDRPMANSPSASQYPDEMPMTGSVWMPDPIPKYTELVDPFQSQPGSRPDHSPVPVHQKKVVCYIYTMTSHKRQNPFAFMPERIDPFLCTHLIYAFADIGTKNNLVSADPSFDLDMNGYANITALKRKNRDLKVMISVGGWKGGSLGFARITATAENRREFAKNAVRFIRGYMFDGLDLNWQHPTFREGGSMKDRENYVLLAQMLREEFDREAMNKNKPRLLLSIAITHHRKFMTAYDIPNFNNYMDFISVIGYDYHFSHESEVHHHAPLYSLENDNDYNYDSKENINHTIHQFMELADPAKLVLGLPTYGRTYRLEDPDDNGLGAYADGAGDKGPFTGENGWLAYFEICNFIERDDWTVVQMKPGSAGPYAYKGNQWVCYDDLEMIKNKAMYAHKMGLGGVMFWTMDYDDFIGTCKKTKMEPGLRTFPIIRTARNALMNPSKYENDYGVAAPQESLYGYEQTPRTTMRPRPMRPTRPMPMSRPSGNYPEYGEPQPPRYPNQMPMTGSVWVPDLGPVYTDDDSAVAESQPAGSSLVEDLLRLIEKNGGMKRFCKILQQEKMNKEKMNMLFKRGVVMKEDGENSLILDTQKTPILLVLSNSSIMIKEVNIYTNDQKSDRRN